MARKPVIARVSLAGTMFDEADGPVGVRVVNVCPGSEENGPAGAACVAEPGPGDVLAGCPVADGAGDPERPPPFRRERLPDRKNVSKVMGLGRVSVYRHRGIVSQD